MADLSELMRRAEMEKAGADSSPGGSLGGYLPAPQDDFKDWLDELEKSYHLSASSRLYEEKNNWTLNFLSKGMSLLVWKELEEEYTKTLLKWLDEQTLVPKVVVAPTSGATDRTPQVELRSNLGGGTTDVAYINALDNILAKRLESIEKEIYYKLLPKRDEMAALLMKHGFLEYRRKLFMGAQIGQEQGRGRLPRLRGE